MLFYKELYFDKECSVKKRKIIWKLRKNSGIVNVYLITNAQATDLFDIVHASVLKQSYFQSQEIVILGIATSKEHAVQIVTRMVNDFSSQYQTIDFKKDLFSQPDNFGKKLQKYKIVAE